MSATATITIPPPTNNTLDKQERARLVRSTRKIGAVLGTTPLLVEAAAIPARTQKDKIRRDALLSTHSASSSISSVASFTTASSATAVSQPPSASEADYIFVRPNGRSAPYQVQAVFDNASPSSSRSSSPMRGVSSRVTQLPSTASAGRKRKQGHKSNSSVAPDLRPTMFPVPVPSGSVPAIHGTSSDPGSRIKQNRSRAKGKDTVTGLAQLHPTQPLLLRLRAAPVPLNTDIDINVNGMDLDLPKTPAPTNPNSQQQQPLSPASSLSNMSLLTVDPFLPFDHANMKSLSDREKRRKMAKLARTLGENIPPELVFRAPNTVASSSNSNASASSSVGPSRTIRRASLSMKPFRNNEPSPPTKSAPLPPLPVAETPRPTHNHCQSTSQAPSQQKTLKRPINLQTSYRRPRPQSLALGNVSAFVAADKALTRKAQKERSQEPSRGTSSLDSQRPTGPSYPVQLLPFGVVTKPCVPPSPRPFITVAAPVSDSEDSEDDQKRSGNGLKVEWGRRKEREWSGEWNLKDMEDVAMKLRCLKGR